MVPGSREKGHLSCSPAQDGHPGGGPASAETGRMGGRMYPGVKLGWAFLLQGAVPAKECANIQRSRGGAL